MMRRYLSSITAFVVLLLLSSCGSQQILSTYVNQDAFPEKPYRSICVVAMVPGHATRMTIEEKTEELLRKRGLIVVRASELFAPPLADKNKMSREEQIKKMKAVGCDGILTITELDVQVKERYVPGRHVQLPPSRYAYYGSYYSYYTYRYNYVYQPGYISREATYFFETNFYDLNSEKLLWSIQSSAFEPNDVDSWFKEYSRMMIRQLKKDEVIEE